MKFVVLMILALLVGCADNTYDCRPDFVGPPGPDVAHLPVCEDPQK